MRPRDVVTPRCKFLREVRAHQLQHRRAFAHQQQLNAMFGAAVQQFNAAQLPANFIGTPHPAIRQAREWRNAAMLLGAGCVALCLLLLVR